MYSHGKGSVVKPAATVREFSDGIAFAALVLPSSSVLFLALPSSSAALFPSGRVARRR